MIRLAESAVLVLTACGAFAQSAPRVEFEVASIKPDKSGDGGWIFTYGNGRLTASNASLWDSIRFAYGVKDYQIRGPSWLKSEKYDINAKAESNAQDDQIMRMLQALLADRFNVSLHRETKMLPVYLLKTANSGPKLQPVESTDERDNFRPGEFTGESISMGSLSERLSRTLDRPVVDKTGLSGVFDLELKWAPVDQPDSPLPSIFTALQEQLGLKLESGNGPVEILVVDHAERPEEN